MPDIRPVRGLRYNPERFGVDLSSVIAPPYDVLDAAGKTRLLGMSDRNVVAVDLPHVPPDAAGPDAVYADAARTLRQWRDDGTLIRDQEPALYVYLQTYTHDGESYTRRMFLAGMRLEAFGTGQVFPHEQTFGGPKEDRLALMKATRCQMSPVFGLYHDEQSELSQRLDPGEREPDATAELEGVINRLWVLTDADTIAAVGRAMADRAVYIADGHHRYGTALTYRDLIAGEGALPEDHPAQFVLVGLCAMEDPGCLILPTHRVLSGLGEVDTDATVEALSAGAELHQRRLDASEPERVWPAHSDADLVLHFAASGRTYTARFTRREVLTDLSPDRSPAWRELDLAYVHRYLIDALMAGLVAGKSAPVVHHVKSVRGAIELARELGGVALITKPCTMAQLRAVSEAGDLMPQKSTFFYPKLATGLVVNPLE